MREARELVPFEYYVGWKRTLQGKVFNFLSPWEWLLSNSTKAMATNLCCHQGNNPKVDAEDLKSWTTEQIDLLIRYCLDLCEHLAGRFPLTREKGTECVWEKLSSYCFYNIETDYTTLTFFFLWFLRFDCCSRVSDRLTSKTAEKRFLRFAWGVLSSVGRVDSSATKKFPHFLNFV